MNKKSQYIRIDPVVSVFNGLLIISHNIDRQDISGERLQVFETRLHEVTVRWLDHGRASLPQGIFRFEFGLQQSASYPTCCPAFNFLSHVQRGHDQIPYRSGETRDSDGSGPSRLSRDPSCDNRSGYRYRGDQRRKCPRFPSQTVEGTQMITNPQEAGQTYRRMERVHHWGHFRERGRCFFVTSQMC
jgi:hypothetical protein